MAEIMCVHVKEAWDRMPRNNRDFLKHYQHYSASPKASILIEDAKSTAIFSEECLAGQADCQIRIISLSTVSICIWPGILGKGNIWLHRSQGLKMDEVPLSFLSGLILALSTFRDTMIFFIKSHVGTLLNCTKEHICTQACINNYYQEVYEMKSKKKRIN